MEAWLRRSQIVLEPQDPLEAREDGRVVVRELARWRASDVPDGAPSTEPAETWVLFEVDAGLVTAVRRYARAEDVPASTTGV